MVKILRSPGINSNELRIKKYIPKQYPV